MIINDVCHTFKVWHTLSTIFTHYQILLKFSTKFVQSYFLKIHPQYFIWNWFFSRCILFKIQTKFGCILLKFSTKFVQFYFSKKYTSQYFALNWFLVVAFCLKFTQNLVGFYLNFQQILFDVIFQKNTPLSISP